MARTPIEWEGAEAIEETGYGRILELNHDPEKRNAQVVIKAEHLEEPVSGWADTSWLPTWGKINELYAVDARCWYRVVVHRRSGVDKTTPFVGLAKRDKVRDLVEIREAPAARSGRTPAATGATAVAEAPAAAPVAPPPPPAAQTPPQAAPAPPAAPTPPERLVTGDPGPTPPGEAPRRARLQEAKPWEPTNSDGSTNLGSYAYQAALGMTELAQELWLKGHPDATLGRDQRPEVERLARRLLAIADAVQSSIRPDGRSDRMDASHARARGALRSAIEALPVPWEATTNERAVWIAVEDHAAWLLSAAVGMLG